MRNDAELRISIINGILENADLHRMTDAYKKSSDAEKVAYLESTFNSLWSAARAK